MCMCIYIYIYIYTHNMCVYIYIYIYIHTHAYLWAGPPGASGRAAAATPFFLIKIPGGFKSRVWPNLKL